MNLWPKRKNAERMYANVVDYRIELLTRRIEYLRAALERVAGIEWSYQAKRIANEALERDKKLQ